MTPPSTKPMKKLPQTYRDFVIDCCQKAAWNIGVSHFKIDIKYMDEEKRRVADEDDDFVTYGEMTVDRRYLHGTLKLYPNVLEKWNKNDKTSVKETVFHEISHLATQHFYDVATSIYKDEGETKDAWETCTEVIGRMALLIDELKNKSRKIKQ